MLSRTLEQTLHRALSYAKERRHEYATLEHLLLALTEDRDCMAVLRACSVDVDNLRSEVTGYLDEELDNLVVERDGDPKPTAGFQRVLQRAAIHVQSSGREEVTGANVLVAIFSERERPRRLLPAGAGNDAARRRQLYQPRHRQERRPVGAQAGARRGRAPGERGAASRATASRPRRCRPIASTSTRRPMPARSTR